MNFRRATIATLAAVAGFVIVPTMAQAGSGPYDQEPCPYDPYIPADSEECVPEDTTTTDPYEETTTTVEETTTTVKETTTTVESGGGTTTQAPTTTTQSANPTTTQSIADPTTTQVAAAGPTTTVRVQLPSTGSDGATSTALIAVVLVGLGAVIVGMTRRPHES